MLFFVDKELYLQVLSRSLILKVMAEYDLKLSSKPSLHNHKAYKVLACILILSQDDWGSSTNTLQINDAYLEK